MLTRIGLLQPSSMSIVQFVTGILLIAAKQQNGKHYFLLKQLYEIEPCSFRLIHARYAFHTAICLHTQTRLWIILLS